MLYITHIDNNNNNNLIQINGSTRSDVKTCDPTKNSTNLISSIWVWTKHKNYSTQMIWIGLGQFEFVGDQHPLTLLIKKSWET